MSNADLADEIRGQLREHWDVQLRPRLEGLTDAEYFWEPTADCWNVRPRGSSDAPVQAGSGAFTIDFAFPEPDPPPVTTIAWRLGHLIVGVLGMRAAAHFDGPPVDYQTFDYAGTAAAALAQLDAAWDLWDRGVAGLEAGRSPVRQVQPRPTRSGAWLPSCCTSTAR